MPRLASLFPEFISKPYPITSYRRSPPPSAVSSTNAVVQSWIASRQEHAMFVKAPVRLSLFTRFDSGPGSDKVLCQLRTIHYKAPRLPDDDDEDETVLKDSWTLVMQAVDEADILVSIPVVLAEWYGNYDEDGEDSDYPSWVAWPSSCSVFFSETRTIVADIFGIVAEEEQDPLPVWYVCSSRRWAIALAEGTPIKATDALDAFIGAHDIRRWIYPVAQDWGPIRRGPRFEEAGA